MPTKLPAAAAVRGGLHLAAAQRRGDRPGRAVARHLLRHLLRDRADQPLRAEPRPAGAVPGRPGVGLPRHPGAARRSPARAAVPLLLVKLWTVYPRLFRRPERGARGWSSTRWSGPRSAVLVASAIFQLATGMANSAAVVPVGLLVPGHPLRDRLGRDRGAGRAHRGQAADHPQGADLRRRVDGRRPAHRDRARAHCRAAGCCGRRGSPRGRGARGRRRARCRSCARSRSSRSAAARGRRACRSTSRRRRRTSPTRWSGRRTGSRWSTATGASRWPARSCQAMTQRTESLPDRLRRGLERGRGVDRRAGPRPARPRGRARRAATSTSTRCSRRAPFRHTVLQGELRRRRPHPAWRWRCTASRSHRDHGEPARLIAPNRPGVLQTKWLSRLEVSA